MKKLGVVLAIFVCLFIIQGLVRSIWTLWEKKDLLVQKQLELTRIKKEYESLKKKEKEVSDPQFAESQIRDKLFLVKPDEKVVILPSGVLSEKTDKKAVKEGIKMPIYAQWITLFLKGKMSQG